jgi:Family of unknown function (DUF5678)
MADIDYVQFQGQYGGRYIARRGGEIIANAETYDALSDHLDGMAVEWDTIIIEYIEPISNVRVY